MKRGLFTIPRANADALNTWVTANIAGAGSTPFVALLSSDGVSPNQDVACNWLMSDADFATLQTQVERSGGFVAEVINDDRDSALVTLSRSIIRQSGDSVKDDLTAITGIGTTRARQLVTVGINTYADLINADTSRLANYMSVGEAMVTDWKRQANNLQ